MFEFLVGKVFRAHCFYHISGLLSTDQETSAPQIRNSGFVESFFGVILKLLQLGLRFGRIIDKCRSILAGESTKMCNFLCYVLLSDGSSLEVIISATLDSRYCDKSKECSLLTVCGCQ